MLTLFDQEIFRIHTKKRRMLTHTSLIGSLRFFLSALALTLAFTFTTTLSAQVNVYSDPAGTVFVSTHVTIQAAIDAGTTMDGYVVRVDAGSYPEMIMVDKSLILRGANTGIAGNGTRVAETIIQDGQVNILGTNTVVFDGFHISHISNSTPVSLAGGATATIQNCLIQRNASAAVSGGPANARGILISNGAGVKSINNNLFTGDASGSVFSGTLSWNTGIFINGPSSVITVEDNVFEVCRTAINIDDMGAGIFLSGNTFQRSGTGVSFGGTVATTGSYTFGANDFKNTVGTLMNLSNVATSFRLERV